MSVLALTCWLAISEARAWEVLTNNAGYELGWHTMPISYKINPVNNQNLSELSITTAIEDAAAQWEAVEDVPVDFESLGTTSLATTNYDDTNLIYFESKWAYDSSLLALTSNWSNAETGQILGFDIRINAQDHLWTVSGDTERDDLQNMITHELGHVLGLDHTNTDTTATMYGSAALGETVKRELKWDDKAGVIYLYSDVALIESRGLFSCNTAAGGSGISVGFMTLASALGVMIRRRRADP